MKVMDYKHLKLLLALLVPLISFGSIAQASSIEVVQSVPIETTLQVPNIRLTDQVWLEMISSAKKSIDLEQFYINNQSRQSLEPILTALIAAANRGVQVRFIVDIKFFQNYPDVPNQLSKIQNIQVKTIDFSSYGGIQHAKFFIVDQSLSFLGSANFDWLALSHIHEVGLKVNDASVSAGLENIFAQDWSVGTLLGGKPSLEFAKILGGGKPKKGMVAIAQLIASPTNDLPSGVSPSLDAIIQLLASARTSIKIQVYQYSTKATKGAWLMLDNEIRKAANRGVQVKLMVDAVALKTSASTLKALTASKNIQVRAVTIPQWSGGPIQYARLIHSKYFTVDGSSSWVGTENWSESYFSGCRNVGLIIPSRDTTAQLDQIFDQVWSSAYAAAL